MTRTGPEPRYDRRAASRVLAGLARPGLGAAPVPPPARRVEYTCTDLFSDPVSHLTLSQLLY
ncbi:copper chaperone, partial [Nocardia tengchongensis]